MAPDDQRRSADDRSDLVIASARVGAIVEAAERAAQELRAHTEARADERIAEADRAAEMRVAAAEAEAADIVAAARAEAARLRSEAQAAVREVHEEAARVRREADVARDAQLAAARDEAARIRTEAQAAADEVRRKARADAQAIVGDADVASRRVLREGSALSEQLEQLSTSLHRNAERLLADVATAHRAMVRELDAASPEGIGEGAPPDARPEAPGGGSDDLAVPEFVPSPRRR